ncbi:MAG: 5-bromo-4-chloroindolyl phosphate hydrolysis family protein [Selenomonadaceae bacterium]|nr:5-bromo-4-chloroindolyl phosphate hydrolysis family protein [Selenomonadaceae bacterium]
MENLLNYLIVILMTAGVIFGGKAFWDWRKNRTPQLDLKELEVERAQFLQENFDKAMQDFNFLEEARQQLSDRELSAQLNRLQRTAKNLLTHLEKHPERIALASKFIDYYQDRAVKIVKQYRELEDTQLSTDKVQDLKDRMKQTLASLDDAYQDQFEHVLNDQIISVDAELTVMQQQLNAEGISTKPHDVGAKDEYGNVRIDTDLLDRPIEIEPPRKFIPAQAMQRRVRRGNDDSQELSPFPEEDRPQIVQTKLIQSALAIFLGAFGAHKFYQGKTIQGVLYFLLSWTTLPTWIGIVEGIRYLFMPVEDFYDQYIAKKDSRRDRDRRRR